MRLQKLPGTIFTHLKLATESKLLAVSDEAHIQVALCYITGLGCKKQVSDAVDVLKRRSANPEASPRFRYALQSISAAWGYEMEHLGDTVLSPLIVDHRAASEASGTSALTSYNGVLTGRKRDELGKLLLEATRQGQADAVRSIIDAGANINHQGAYGETALHILATASDEVTIVTLAKLLLQMGANTKIRTAEAMPASDRPPFFGGFPSGRTALEWAISREIFPLVKVLFDQAEPAEVAMDFEHVAYACHYQSIRTLQYMAQKEGFKDLLSQGDTYGRTALFYAVRPEILPRTLRFQADRASAEASLYPPIIARQIEVVSILRDSGSSWEMCHSRAFGVLHVLAADGDESSVHAFLQSFDLKQHLNSINYHGWNPLKDAVALERPMVVKCLLEHGANPRNVCPAYKSSALHSCGVLRDELFESIVGPILNRDDSLVNTQDCWGNTVLHKAAGIGNAQLAEFAIRHGNRLLVKNKPGFTPLGLAIGYRSTKTVRILLAEHRRQGLPLICHTAALEDQIGSGNCSPLSLILWPGTLSEPEATRRT